MSVISVVLGKVIKYVFPFTLFAKNNTLFFLSVSQKPDRYRICRRADPLFLDRNIQCLRACVCNRISFRISRNLRSISIQRLFFHLIFNHLPVGVIFVNAGKGILPVILFVQSGGLDCLISGFQEHCDTLPSRPMPSFIHRDFRFDFGIPCCHAVTNQVVLHLAGGGLREDKLCRSLVQLVTCWSFCFH